MALEEETGLGAETLDDTNVDAVMNIADDGEEDDTGIECQCCFADYPFVRAFLLPVAHFTLF